MNEPFDLIVACAFGLETLVRRELQAIGIEATVGEPGRVLFSGTQEDICKANLWLRTADRILIRVASFPAADFDALFESTRDIQWGNLVPVDAEFPVTGRCLRSTLSSVPACQRAVKRAVVDAMMRDHHVSSLPESGPLFRIDFTIVKDQATLAIDTTGLGLNHRGYHGHGDRPQIKETLAAAMVMLSYWQNGRPLLDPFCGGGTIAIEAARLGRNIAPGSDRNFACESWPGLSQELWQSLRDHASTQVLGPLETRVVAGDIDSRAIREARHTAKRAGVDGDIHFATKSVDETTSQRRFGCLITRPPDHGGVEGDRQLNELYSLLPDVFRRLPTWSHYVLTAFPRFESFVGRKADRRRKLYRGRVASTYYQFHGPKPVTNDPKQEGEENSQEGDSVVPASQEGESENQASQAAVEAEEAATAPRYEHASGSAAFGQLGDKAGEQAQLFAARLRNRAKHLRRWPTKRGITCYRLYERDVPEIPLVVDRYEDSLHITEFERPHERTPAEHGNWLDLMAETAGKTLEVSKGNIHFKRRGRQRGKTQHTKVAETQQRLEVHEGGLKFLVNLADYVDTGLFLDHRVTRKMVRDEAKGKSFLNLFAYTGAFSVYAADGGAAKTVTVDLSRNYLDWAKANMTLNGFTGPEHSYVASDISQFLDNHPPGESYDLVVVDPPTFSNSKRTEQDWAVQDGAVSLLTRLMPLVRKGGTIYFSTNFRRFKFDPAAIPASHVHEISKQTVPEDFRNRRIHRCWKIIR